MPAATSDLNLLFGMLALQLDFLTRDQLLDGMHAWVLDKSRPLGQILLKQGVLTEDRLSLLDAVVQKHLEIHGNDASRSLAAVGAAGVARETLEGIHDAELDETIARVQAQAETRGDDFATTVPATPSDGERFHILRPHAKGGLGVVFVAIDREVGREVALKEIQIQLAHDADCRARFLREAAITGGLEHPGIVPVYGLGRYADGRPYYAMRFIRGESLKETIDRRRPRSDRRADPAEQDDTLRQLLTRFVDVCNAIEYAHSKGVLHRDLKPSNIMIGKFGETLVVDWGLAKVVDRADASDNPTAAIVPASPDSGGTPTQVGSTIGTPAFMSPEQAAGRLDQVSPASDVYSLGATLYYLLTGRAPFDQDHVVEILTRVRDGEFPRPRTIDASIPRGLEAICLKAMALSPGDRYASAANLRQDIEHWLADVPVSAWNEPLWVKGRRWLSRHKVAASMVSAGILVATIGLAIATGLLTTLNNRLAVMHEKERLERQRTEEQVVALFLERGQQAANKGDRFLAAQAYVEAIARETDPKSEALQRIMLGSLLQRMPILVWSFDAGAPVRHASFSPDGDRVVVAAASGSARIVNARDGTPIGPALTHDGPVSWTAFRADGGAVATASADQTVRLWNADTGTPLVGPLRHTGPVNQVMFDPTGTRVMTAAAASAPFVWDAVTGKPRFDLERKIAIPSQDGAGLRWNDIPLGNPSQPALVQIEWVGDEILTVSDQGLIRLLPANDPDSPARFETFAGSRAVQACYDFKAGVLVAACVNGDILRFQDLKTAPNRRSPSRWIFRHEDGASCVAISPDHARIGSGGVNRNAVIDLSRAPAPAENPAPADSSKANPTNPRDTTDPPAGAGDIDMANSQLRGRAPGSRLINTHRILHHNHTVHRVEFDITGRFVLTASEDQTARMWSADTGEPVTPPLRHGAAVRFAAWSPDGTHVLTCGEDGQARLWNVADVLDGFQFVDLRSEVNFVAFSSSGKSFAAAAESGDARLWDSITGQPQGPVLKHPGFVRFAILNHAGTKLVTSCADRKLRFWDVSSGQTLAAVPLRDRVSEMELSGDGRRFVTACDDGSLAVWNLDDASLIAEASDPEAARSADPRSDFQGRLRIAINHDGSRFLSVGMGENLKVWDGDTGRLLRTIATGNRAIHDVEFGPDGRQCYTAGTHGARVWDTDSGRPVSPSMRQSGNIYSADFSPDGKLLATAGSDGLARVWEIATGASLTPALAHDRYVQDVRFSPDGDRLLTVSADHLRVWDVATGAPLTQPLRHGMDEITEATFDPAGARIASAGRDGTARIWTLAAPELRPVADLRDLLSRITCLRYTATGQLVPTFGALDDDIHP